MLLERAHRTGTKVGDWADVEDNVAVGDLAHKSWILFGADPVADAVGVELLEPVRLHVLMATLSAITPSANRTHQSPSLEK